MMREPRSRVITSPLHYWHDWRVVHAILRYLGGRGTDWHAIESVDAAYLAIIDTNQVSAWGAMARPIASAALEDEIAAQQGLLDLSTSLWHKDDRQRPGYPRRALLVWDIDWFGPDAAAPFQEPCRVLRQVEPVLQVLEAALAAYGIAHITVVTGKGAHLVTAIPAHSPVMDELIRIGNVIEPTVLAKQAAGHSPWAALDGRPVPPASELSFKGAVRLQQFLITRQIGHARQATNLPVEISDIGQEGIALDNTAATGTVNTRTISVLGSIYKPQKRPSATAGQFIIRIPRTGPGFELSLHETLRLRRDWSMAAEYLGTIDSRIPDGSAGVRKLIREYDRSALAHLHRAMDRSFGDEPGMFAHGYRNYAAIARQTSDPGRIAWLIAHANTALLQPANLAYFIEELFRAWGGSRDDLAVAPHVAGLLRAIYEDPALHWWNRWMGPEDALRHARGWVEQVLGRMFEQ